MKEIKRKYYKVLITEPEVRIIQQLLSLVSLTKSPDAVVELINDFDLLAGNLIPTEELEVTVRNKEIIWREYESKDK